MKKKDYTRMKNVCLFIVFLLAYCLLSIPCSAGQQTIEAEGVYTAGDDPSVTISVAKERAREVALRNALDKAGIYVESYSRIENMVLTHDEIKVLAGNVIDVKKTTYSLDTVQGEILRCKAQVEAVIKTDDIDDILSKGKEEIQAWNERNKQLLQGYSDLKNENKKLYNPIEIELLNLYQKIMDYSTRNDEKIKLCKKILNINPAYRNGIVYEIMGTVYSRMKKYDKALECDLKYLAINNKNANAYYACGMDYFFLGDMVQAYSNVYTATVMNPQNETYRIHMRYIKNCLNQAIS